MKRVLVVLMLLIAVAAFGAVDAQSYINDGVKAKTAGDHAVAAVAFAKATEVAAPGSKLRCVGLRCYIYSLTKTWEKADLVKGDAAAVALEKEYAEDGDARMARATWWGRRQFELLKVGDAAGSIPFGEQSLAARKDLPMYGNNVVIAYCEVADVALQKGNKVVAKTDAQRALAILATYKIEGKLAETKTRAEKILAKAN